MLSMLRKKSLKRLRNSLTWMRTRDRDGIINVIPETFRRAYPHFAAEIASKYKVLYHPPFKENNYAN